MQAAPTEIIIQIFHHLTARELISCRQVCSRWKQIVDGMVRCDSFWRNHCSIDFNLIYKIARTKARCGLRWFHIYRSLSLWPKLNSAKETRDEFASATSINEEICGLSTLRNGIIGVHSRRGIDYYDIETLERTKRESILGTYLSYIENDDIIVIASYSFHLFILRKTLHESITSSRVNFDQVKFFILVEKKVFFVTLSDDIYVCNLDDKNFAHQLMHHSEDSIMCLGYTTHLNVLTYERSIYSFIGGKRQYACTLDENSNLLHQFHKYNFLETLDWRVFFNWMFILNHSVPNNSLRDIITVKTYGDIIFVGSNWGVLRIYYAPYDGEQFDFFAVEPVKQYNFMERSDCPVLSTCPIIQIDVMESEEGHTVLAAMPKKIAVLEFIHNFSRNITMTMLPYKDLHKVNISKIDDCT